MADDVFVISLVKMHVKAYVAGMAWHGFLFLSSHSINEMGSLGVILQTLHKILKRKGYGE